MAGLFPQEVSKRLQLRLAQCFLEKTITQYQGLLILGQLQSSGDIKQKQAD